MPKQGTTFSLAVDFTGVDLDAAERIEFIFRRGPTNASPLIKRCVWPGEAAREEGGSRILVPWTEAETWLVPGDGTFYPFPRMRGGDPLLWVRRKQAQCFSPVYAGVTLRG